MGGGVAGGEPSEILTGTVEAVIVFVLGLGLVGEMSVRARKFWCNIKNLLTVKVFKQAEWFRRYFLNLEKQLLFLVQQ